MFGREIKDKLTECIFENVVPEGHLSQKSPERNLRLPVNNTKPTNTQLQNNTVNGAMSIIINWVIKPLINRSDFNFSLQFINKDVMYSLVICM